MTQIPDPTQLFRLDGKVALVTGGSRGLGKEMVEAFARCGADVVISSRKQEACDTLAEQVAKETGQRTLAVGCHVGDWDQCDDLAKRTLDAFGRVDILVNNAGMSPLYPSVVEITEALYDKVMAVNLKGAFRLSALLGTAMAEADGGSIINVSSIAAVSGVARPRFPMARRSPGLHSNLTQEHSPAAFAPKVRVNCIMPGPFLTDISKAWTPQMLAFLEKSLPLQRGGQPNEIVGAALFLGSDASSYVTGSILKVDGGATYGMG